MIVYINIYVKLYINILTNGVKEHLCSPQAKNTCQQQPHSCPLARCANNTQRWKPSFLYTREQSGQPVSRHHSWRFSEHVREAGRRLYKTLLKIFPRGTHSQFASQFSLIWQSRDAVGYLWEVVIFYNIDREIHRGRWREREARCFLSYSYFSILLSN